MKLKSTFGYGVFLLKESFLSFIRNQGLEKASVLAYNSFFALFPLVLLLLFIAGRFMATSLAAMEAVNRLAAQMMPMFGDVVVREVEALAFQKAWGLVSLLLLFWGVTPLASSLRRAFSQIYGIERDLPFLKEKLKDALAVLLMLVLLVLLVVGEIAYALVTALVMGMAGKMPFLVRLADLVAPIVVTVVFLSIVHYVFAPKRPRLIPVLTGALASALMLALMGPAFTAIMRFNPNYGFAFGSLKAVFLLLVWVYSAFVAILAGVEISSAFHRRESLLVKELLASPARLAVNVSRMGRYLRTCEPGELVFREGESGDTMYYIASGSVTLSCRDHDLRTMGSGEYFGEMAMLLKTTRTATARAAAPGTILVAVSADNLQEVLHQNPSIMLQLLREMAQRLGRTNNLIG